MNTTIEQTQLHTNTLEAIRLAIDEPQTLEKLYRKNKQAFQKAFDAAYPGMKGHSLADAWNERLHYKEDEISWGVKNELWFVLVAAAITGFLIKLPQIFNLDSETYLMRNLGLAILPMMGIYHAYKQSLPKTKWLVPLIAALLSALYINGISGNNNSDSIILACIHLPIFLWSIVGYVFIGGDLKNQEGKVGFLRYNGELVVLSAIMMLAGGLFLAITFNLFSVTGIDVEPFFEKYLVVWGPASVPLLATFLVSNNKQLVNRISPLVARIFTPLVLVMLVAFLASLLGSDKSLYHDREFLLLFNALLLGVMAIILFSVTEASRKSIGRINLMVLLSLSILTIISNALALSAIGFRLYEYGASPNRLAVLGANLLIFLNLIWVAKQLFLMLKGKADVEQVEQVIARFLPLYAIWTAIVTFVLPFVFGFK